jgi:hypothetical protein
VFILKTVKVLCFDTLLQVLILNDLQGDLDSTDFAMILAAQHRQMQGPNKNAATWLPHTEALRGCSRE